MTIKEHIQELLSDIVQMHYQTESVKLEIQDNKTDFEGDYTIVIFPLIKIARKKPEEVGEILGQELLLKSKLIKSFNVVKGFLNVSIEESYFITQLDNLAENLDVILDRAETVMVEYSSPNTNKPLHLGHVRNNLLGFSIAKILEEGGYNVIKTQVINDRGIHICKSMLAWEKFGEGKTPETENLKGDKLVGNYYVKFDQEYKKQIEELISNGSDEASAKKNAPLILEAQEMLLKWEKNDPEVRALWEKMNAWVYKGFEETYKNLGVDFDQVQYESKTYILGKDIIQEGLSKNVFYKKEDGSVWCDLSEEGLDEKLLLRSDGTSVYMTQDLGTAVQRFKENSLQKLIYTVGNEQDYHFQVLFLILKKLGYNWASQLYHLSYGMVELPNGKMKSREGTVVDADELLIEMYQTAKEKAEELGKLEQISEEEKEISYKKVGLSALKYFMLKIDPKKKMLFNPAESIDFNGNTGPFIQYTYARIFSLLNKAGYDKKSSVDPETKVNIFEKALILQLSNYKETVTKSAETLSPAQIANYVYDLVKTYNSFYQNNNIMNLENENDKQYKLKLSATTAETIKKCLNLLGIEVVNRM
ncbi:arginine--tRNA ligase [Halpernia frigidisoli]|uniref:Arginine--tRNA ligase n=1 Tax=Halpernia frigidisoli TaxID=1125876 RepID=A0A1I3J7C3_9FLAO|nr:arginine--tRNA ligase [Halpernia frigidisoli]SFI56060.1 arginyl-tRNA synthetase [Halpernia frigidisoli]